MRRQKGLWGAVMAGALALGAWLVLTLGMLWSTLEPHEQAQVAELVAPRIALLFMAWVLAAIAWWAFWQHVHRRHIGAPQRLAEQVRGMLGGASSKRLAVQGEAGMAALAAAINALADQREALRGDVAAQIEQASQGVQQEKSRLAALMAELTQSVVVCNLDGRILLYNNRARLQFRALSQAPTLAGGAELVGIGRSIYAVFDRELVAHALERIQERRARGASHPSAQFITTTRSGQLLKVQMAPVGQVGSDDAQAPLAGFVLMLDNVTRHFEDEAQRDQALQALTDGSRSALANIQAAVDMLGFDDLEPTMRERFLAVVRDEVRTLTTRLNDSTQRAAEGLKTRWPMEEMLAADFVVAAQRRIEAHCGFKVVVDEVEAGLWLRVDSFILLQALAYLSQRLRDEFALPFVALRVAAAGGRAQLDLIWNGSAMSTETVMSWEMDPMRLGAEHLPLSVRDVLDRHSGEMWFERDRARAQAFFRFLLPQASAQDGAEQVALAQLESRPEYYDFDLFSVRGIASDLDDVPLTELTYTVFDTETTGLNPSGGDEIIQIGATRIVNGKLLRQESFEQLVHPGRAIPAASIPIHGITDDMVRDQPAITAVLPAFHAFAQDTVLVAHNAAFDMKFLQLLERRTGLSFRQPVLDTLLLSAVAQPSQDSHRLEAIAERFDITVLGRHTALGDALVTAEVLLRLLPLLQQQGIHTLRQAREAAEKTYYARLKY
ncbi:3'-5' exonuclease [Hydrogenophaga defluvii]|uniref:DNA-directed DNA polymerase n=1 Tax=Hydrogenophaga defluvii TaxID=249410 RepID=A0ABW2S9W2_9BURK